MNVSHLQPVSSDVRVRRGGVSRVCRRVDGPSRAALRLLAALRAPEAAALPDPTRPGTLVVSIRRGGVSLGGGAHPATAARELVAHDLATASPRDDGAESYAISPPGLAWLRRDDAVAGQEFVAQHRDIVLVGEGVAAHAVNAAESPLAWLRRRRDRDGEPLIDAAAFEAGERLRRDITQAGMLPSVTARWDGAVASGGAALRDPAGATDAAIAARQRVRRAVDALGGDFADLLVDLCGFLKGLELIERERGWPPRSAKVVIRLALAALARHYGLTAEAVGPDRSRGLRSWSAEEE